MLSNKVIDYLNKQGVYSITDLSDIIPNTVIPFAIDPFGNYFVFDKAEGKIYFLEMEEVALSLLASDFESFISSLKKE